MLVRGLAKLLVALGLLYLMIPLILHTMMFALWPIIIALLIIFMAVL